MSAVLEAQVAVVGAGPTGAAAALALRQQGISDVVLLDSRDFPRDKICGSGLSPRAIEMIWDDLVLPCYGWLFPETPTRVNIGITYDDDNKSKNARQLFQRFLDKHFRDRIASGKQIRGLRGFPIVYTYRCELLSSPGRLIAGEAGRLTHPATGEGISQGLGSALFAADAIADILAGRCAESEALRRYDRRCSRTFIPSFWLGRAFRAALHTPLLDWIVRAGSVPAVQRATARLLTHF
jgi:flavin-dependent dehydrogenase